MNQHPMADLHPSLPVRSAVWMFLSFAFTYFFSTLIRGVTATLAPQFSAELGLNAGQLGLLAGAYFLGFASTQLPLGSALDRLGSRRVLMGFLVVAVLGCMSFALARDFLGLTLARALIGVGVSACLMAPMTTFRRSFSPVAQLRANSWMLMTGSFGMVAATLPVQWLLPVLGWRGLFWSIAGMLVLAIAMIARWAPRDPPPALHTVQIIPGGYLDVLRHPTFVRFAPMGFFQYGGLIAMQSLWAGPWLIQVCGWTPRQAAQGLFAINLSMLLSFLSWGVLVPRLFARGWTPQRLITRGAPLSLLALLLAVLLGPEATAWVWVLFCAGGSVLALSQPAVAQALPPSLAGRALSAFNLVIFLGVFTVQWGIGLVLDMLRDFGWSTLSAYQGAIALLGCCTTLSYLWFLRRTDSAVA